VPLSPAPSSPSGVLLILSPLSAIIHHTRPSKLRVGGRLSEGDLRSSLQTNLPSSDEEVQKLDLSKVLEFPLKYDGVVGHLSGHLTLVGGCQLILIAPLPSHTVLTPFAKMANRRQEDLIAL